MSKKQIAKLLIANGDDLSKQKQRPKDEHHISDNPHLFVLGCVMNRQIARERAWLIPQRVANASDVMDSSLEAFSKIELDWLKDYFTKHNLHRFNNKMAQVFWQAVARIKTHYNSDASNIWYDKEAEALRPTTEILNNFLAFNGVGIKVSTTALNLLARQYALDIDLTKIDISLDRNVKRVFYRLRLSATEEDKDVIKVARELYPAYPGVFTSSLSQLGLSVCKAKVPQCRMCYLRKLCLRQGVSI